MALEVREDKQITLAWWSNRTMVYASFRAVWAAEVVAASRDIQKLSRAERTAPNLLLLFMQIRALLGVPGNGTRSLYIIEPDL